MNRVFLMALMLASGACLAQSKVPIFVASTVSSGDDAGARMLFELKEVIRDSDDLRLVEHSTELPYIKVTLVTVANASRGTAAAIVLSYDSRDMPLNGAYISVFVQTCPAANVVNCARAVLGEVDRALETLRREAPNLSKTLGR